MGDPDALGPPACCRAQGGISRVRAQRGQMEDAFAVGCRPTGRPRGADHRVCRGGPGLFCRWLTALMKQACFLPADAVSSSMPLAPFALFGGWQGMFLVWTARHWSQAGSGDYSRRRMRERAGAGPFSRGPRRAVGMGDGADACRQRHIVCGRCCSRTFLSSGCPAPQNWGPVAQTYLPNWTSSFRDHHALRAGGGALFASSQSVPHRGGAQGAQLAGWQRSLPRISWAAATVWLDGRYGIVPAQNPARAFLRSFFAIPFFLCRVPCPLPGAWSLCLLLLGICAESPLACLTSPPMHADP